MLGSLIVVGVLGLMRKSLYIPPRSTYGFIAGRSIFLILTVLVSYAALQRGPVVLVSPLREVGWGMTDIFVGLYIFHERKLLSRYAIVGIVLGIIGAILLAL